MNGKILAALQGGPRLNTYLSSISLDYGRRIRDLRALGHTIHRDKIDRGINLYTLRSEPDPEWWVKMVVTLADGTQSVQCVKVCASNVGEARNRAQHLAASVKIASSWPVNP